MLVCPLCRLALADNETTCPRDGQPGVQSREADVPPAVRARFTIVETYGQGASGELYLADDQQTGRRGVLKMLRLPPNVTPAEKARLKRELVKQATIGSPVLSVPLATGDANGLPWIFREWHEGVSLRVKLTRGGALAVPEALLIASQVAAALDELHRAGLLHRDIKPGHILLNPQPSGMPRVTVIDPGIAARIETGAVFDVTGTPEYCSPEQAKGKLVSFRSDLYALGCVLFEMLTGTPPFAGKPSDVLAAHAEKAAPTPKVSMPTGVSTLLSQLLAKDPRERPFSAQQVRRALEPFLPEDAKSSREATQTFERLSEKRRVPVPGRGTLPPPSKNVPGKGTIVGMPAPSLSSKPPPPPPGAKKPRPDGTEELSALDLEGAEEILAKSADSTVELSAVDLEPAAPDATIAEVPRVENPAAFAATMPGTDSPPPWQQTPMGDDSLDYDDLAETKAIDRDAAPQPASQPASQPAVASQPQSQPSAHVQSAAPRAAQPVQAPKKKGGLVPLLAIGGVVGVCALTSIAGAGVMWFISGSEDAPEVGPVAVVEPTPVGQPAPPEPLAPPPAPAPVVRVQPEPVAAAEPEPVQEEADEAPVAPAEPVREERAEAAPRQTERSEPRARREEAASGGGGSRVDQFNRAREEALEHFRARRFPQAAAAYEQATQLNSRHAGSFAGLGASRLALGQHGQAVRAYQRAIELQPRHAGYHAALGQAYLASGDRNRARQAFTRALSLDPNNNTARQGLSRL